MGSTRCSINRLRPRGLTVASIRVRLWADAVGQAITSEQGFESGSLTFARLIDSGELSGRTQGKEEDLHRETIRNGPTDKQREARGNRLGVPAASMFVLGSDGELNVATSLVDDEGVDLVFYRSAEDPRFPSK